MYRDRRHDLIFRDEMLTTGQKVNAQELYGKPPPPGPYPRAGLEYLVTDTELQDLPFWAILFIGCITSSMEVINITCNATCYGEYADFEGDEAANAVKNVQV